MRFEGYDSGFAVMCFSLALSVIGVRDHQARTAQAILAAINDSKQMIYDARAKDSKAIAADVIKTINDTVSAEATK